ARAMSRSRLMPGNTSTADFMARLLSQTALGQNLNPEIFDHRVGEQFLCRILQRRLGAGAIGALELDVKHLALAHAGDAINAERPQRPLDSFALRIENTGFQRDRDAGFHQVASVTTGAFGCGAGLLVLAGTAEAAAESQPLTSIGPAPCGRSPSLMMPSRL